jgi:hypothetical protein
LPDSGPRGLFVLADGTVIRRDVGHCLFDYEGIVAPSPVVLGEVGDAALLGTITLENLGLALNPFERTLRDAHAAGSLERRRPPARRRLTGRLGPT